MGDTPDIPERTSRFLDHLESRENEEETLLAAKEHLEDAKRQLAELLEQMGKATRQSTCACPAF